MNRRLIITASAMLIIGISAGYWLANFHSETHDVKHTVSKIKTQEPLFYRNPMNPQITSPVPAKDSMGMDYIPVYAEDDRADETAGTVTIDPVTVQNMGVRTVQVKRDVLSHVVRTVGRVGYDEESHRSRATHVRLIEQINPGHSTRIIDGILWASDQRDQCRPVVNVDDVVSGIDVGRLAFGGSGDV